jgi:hypothetical protein
MRHFAALVARGLTLPSVIALRLILLVRVKLR